MGHAGSTPPEGLPEGRYGPTRSAGSRRWRRWLFTGTAVVVASAVAFVGYTNLGSAPISAERIGFDVRSDDAMEITIRVRRDEPERPAVCIVRVRDSAGSESGRKEVYVAPSDGDTVLSAVVRSARPPVTADTFACSYDVPEYLAPSDGGTTG
ncbi:DUF4307 domain-containing protein [Haloechinothrix sp. YIM 98757]|uniref:DUF4307 domain-containing protein n=1 Tax=Haloechinothrix aidingensis TaxID=2752311 RepID=A0A837ZYX3_9PSEU|nr:DUF4307 domain-containing protein [Haloechinothrix aidingensis]